MPKTPRGERVKIYTKTGDDGETGLFGGPRVPKNSPRIEAYGTVDELNAVLGVARCAPLPPAIDATVARMQHELFHLGAELATPDPTKSSTAVIGAPQIERLEAEIDAHEATLEPLKQFILPGGSPAAAQLHLARTVCRRAERDLLTLMAAEPAAISPALLVYLNRLSDLLFVLARAANATLFQADVPWQKQG
jgi:cob(I)alamin adenosyltransferase